MKTEEVSEIATSIGAPEIEDESTFAYDLAGLQMLAQRIEAPHKQRIEQLRDALQALYDEQNGPPLIRDAARWEAAMQLSSNALEQTNGYKCLPFDDDNLDTSFLLVFFLH